VVSDGWRPEGSLGAGIRAHLEGLSSTCSVQQDLEALAAGVGDCRRSHSASQQH
jgi:hypothetical protein